MPRNDHLAWSEIKQFGSLWDANDPDIPANAAQVMQDCYPYPRGGLRAFYKGVNYDPFLGTPHVDEAVTAAIVGGADSIVFSVSDVDTDEAVLWRWTPLTASNAVALYTVTNLASSNSTRQFAGMVNFTTTAGGPATYWIAWNDLSVGNGSALWRFGGVGNAQIAMPADVDAKNILRSLVTHQSRLVVASNKSIHWSDEGTDTFSAGNFIRFLDSDNKDAQVQSVIPTSTSDLVVILSNGACYLVQGDLNDPVVRSMPPVGDGALIANLPSIRVFANGTIATIALRQGVFVGSPHGTEWTLLSENLSPEVWETYPSAADMTWPFAFTINAFMGDILALEDFYFCSPHAYHAAGELLVYDKTTNSWFTSTAAPGAVLAGSWLYAGGDTAQRLIAMGSVNQGDLGDAIWYMDLEEDNRAESFTWTSAPLRDQQGRQVEIREVHLVLHAFNDATSTVQVTVNGTTKSETLPLGRSNQVFQFRERADHLDVTITSASNATGVEAPTVEVARIGWQSGHRLY